MLPSLKGLDVLPLALPFDVRVDLRTDCVFPTLGVILELNSSASEVRSN